MTADRLPLSQAQLIAARFADMLFPHSTRLLVAGSIRRQVSTVKDCEIVYQPTVSAPRFFENAKQSRLIIPHIYDDNKGRWGDKFKGFVFEGLRIEAFAADDWNWGAVALIRTGPGPANTDLMIATARTNYRFKEGYLWYATDWWLKHDGTWESKTKRRVKVTEEQTLFELMGVHYVYPWERTDNLYKGRKLFPNAPDESLMDEPEMVQGEMF